MNYGTTKKNERYTRERYIFFDREENDEKKDVLCDEKKDLEKKSVTREEANDKEANEENRIEIDNKTCDEGICGNEARNAKCSDTDA